VLRVAKVRAYDTQHKNKKHDTKDNDNQHNGIVSFMLSVEYVLIMLSVVMLTAIMLSVVAPSR
jgi:hypothetical protein